MQIHPGDPAGVPRSGRGNHVARLRAEIRVRQPGPARRMLACFPTSRVAGRPPQRPQGRRSLLRRPSASCVAGESRRQRHRQKWPVGSRTTTLAGCKSESDRAASPRYMRQASPDRMSSMSPCDHRYHGQRVPASREVNHPVCRATQLSAQAYLRSCLRAVRLPGSSRRCTCLACLLVLATRTRSDRLSHIPCRPTPPLFHRRQGSLHVA